MWYSKCDDKCGYVYFYQSFDMYIISLPIHSMIKSSIYQFNGTDIVIITLGVLGK